MSMREIGLSDDGGRLCVSLFASLASRISSKEVEYLWFWYEQTYSWPGWCTIGRSSDGGLGDYLREDIVDSWKRMVERLLEDQPPGRWTKHHSIGENLYYVLNWLDPEMTNFQPSLFLKASCLFLCFGFDGLKTTPNMTVRESVTSFLEGVCKSSSMTWNLTGWTLLSVF